MPRSRVEPGIHRRLTRHADCSYASQFEHLVFKLGDVAMHRPSAQEFLQALLETLDDLPPDFAHRFEEVLKQEHVDRSQALRQLFEEYAGD